VRLRRLGRHPHPHRAGGDRPALLLRQAPQARDEPAGHRHPGREHRVVSGPLPGAAHDLTAIRIRGILQSLAASGLITLADEGYHGAGEPVLTPYRERTSRNPRNRPTAPTPGSAHPADAPTPSSKPGESCAPRPGRGAWPPTSTRPGRSRARCRPGRSAGTTTRPADQAAASARRHRRGPSVLRRAATSTWPRPTSTDPGSASRRSPARTRRAAAQRCSARTWSASRRRSSRPTRACSPPDPHRYPRWVTACKPSWPTGWPAPPTSSSARTSA
jgi:hypothetical protein